MSNNDTKLDHTSISKTDIKELNKDNKDDSTTNNPTTKKEKTSSSVKAKSKAAPPKESESKNPQLASVDAIQKSLANESLRKDFLNNVADSLASYSRRKMDDDEKESLKNIVNNELLDKVFRVKKLA